MKNTAHILLLPDAFLSSMMISFSDVIALRRSNRSKCSNRSRRLGRRPPTADQRLPAVDGQRSILRGVPVVPIVQIVQDVINKYLTTEAPFDFAQDRLRAPRKEILPRNTSTLHTQRLCGEKSRRPTAVSGRWSTVNAIRVPVVPIVPNVQIVQDAKARVYHEGHEGWTFRNPYSEIRNFAP
jgi:hypothetical protein